MSYLIIESIIKNICNYLKYLSQVIINVTQYITFCRTMKNTWSLSTYTAQEVVLSKNKDCQRGCVLALQEERGMEGIRYTVVSPMKPCLFNYRQLRQIPAPLALPFLCQSKRTVYTSYLHFTTTHTCYTVTSTPTPPVSKASLPEISSDLKSPHPVFSSSSSSNLLVASDIIYPNLSWKRSPSLVVLHSHLPLKTFLWLLFIL